MNKLLIGLKKARFYTKRWWRICKRNVRKYGKQIAGVIVLAVVVGTITVGYIYATLPDVTNIAGRIKNKTIKYYDRTGEIVLYESYIENKRIEAPLEDISEYVIDATIAIEDRSFYEHQGFNVKRLIGAVLVDIREGRYAQGASTLTQQLVKNAILTKEKTIIRKVKELLLALKLEKNFSKEEILEMYLNEISYGGNIYGVEAAAQTYFGKTAKDVTLEEAAILAALPQAPSYYSPYGSNIEELRFRKRVVLNAMVRDEYVSKAESEAAKEIEVEFLPRRENIIAPHFVFYVRDKLEREFGTLRVERGGFSVITTLDMNWQTVAEDAIEKQLEYNRNLNANNAAVVAMDVDTKEVRAMVGSANFFDEEIDGQVNVAVKPRQPGSSVKPIVYATGFENGLTPDTVVYDLETDFINTDGETYHPTNYNGKEYGPVSLRKALAGSLNIPAVKTLYLTTLPVVLEKFRDLRYSTIGDESRYGLSLVLGGLEVKLLEHTNAYAALAREGVWEPFDAMLKVTDDTGDVMWERSERAESKRVFDEQPMRLLHSVMSDNGARSFAFGESKPLTLSDRLVAAKTGTTNKFVDAWTMGFIPQAVVGVWVGNSNGTPMDKGADGSTVAGPIWQDIMSKIAQEYTAVDFNEPDEPVSDKPILLGTNAGNILRPTDVVTGQIIPDDCLNVYPSNYIVEKYIPYPVSILKEVVPGDITGAAPENLDSNKQFIAWNEPIQKWAEENNLQTSISFVPNCAWRNEIPQGDFRVTYPQEGQIIMNNVLQPLVEIVGNTPEKLDVYFDDDLVYSGGDINPAVQLPIGIGNGIHTVTLRVVTKEKNVFEKKITVNTSADIIDPVPVTWQEEDIEVNREEEKNQFTLKLGSTDIVKSVDCYAYQGGRQIFVDSKPVTEHTVVLSASRTLLEGEYAVQCRVNLIGDRYQLTIQKRMTVQ